MFKWTPKREEAVLKLSEGYTVKEVAESLGVSERQIYRWKADIEFSSELDRLSLMVGIANRAERLRIAKRIVKTLIDRRNPTERDLLDWLKYAQSETDGVKLDLTALLEAASSVADTGQVGISSDATGEDDPAGEVQE